MSSVGANPLKMKRYVFFNIIGIPFIVQKKLRYLDKYMHQCVSYTFIPRWHEDTC